MGNEYIRTKLRGGKRRKEINKETRDTKEPSNKKV